MTSTVTCSLGADLMAAAVGKAAMTSLDSRDDSRTPAARIAAEAARPM
jgi:hypothetical protein